MKIIPIIVIAFIACSSPLVQPKITNDVSSKVVMPATLPEPVILDEPTSAMCPEDMKHVSGMFCTSVTQNCIRYLDSPTNKFARCAEFAPSICTGKKIYMDFCIDIEEHHLYGDDMPSNDVTFGEATQTCSQEDKQLCQENEWTFACEGEQMFPYTTGLVRPSDKCNFDKSHLTDENGKFRNQSVSIGENLECLSPFGIHNMNGNVDEWIILEHSYTNKSGFTMWSGLKGGWWAGLRDRCRPVTVGHGGGYHDIQTGYRCCKVTQ